MVPNLGDCRQLMEEYQMLANIKAHSIVVARIAELLTECLGKKGVVVPLDLAISGALLHDIGKTICLRTQENHAVKGREICLRHGYDDIASIVEEHVLLQGAFPDQELSATEVVYYADKRVNHDQIVALSERLEYILEHYGLGDPDRCQAIEKNFQRCVVIEEEIFSRLSFGPSQLAEEVERASGAVSTFFGTIN